MSAIHFNSIEEKQLHCTRLLGRSELGQTHEGTYRGYTPVAIKTIKIHSDATVNNEVRLWSTFSHPNLLPCLGICEGLDCIQIVTKLMRTSLAILFAENSREVSSKWEHYAFSIVKGLDHLHFRGIVHSRIALNNILIQDSEVVLADFGLPELHKKKQGWSVAVSGFESPEQFGRIQVMTLESDIYSVGKVIWTMVAEKLPFSQYNSLEVTYLHKVITGERELLPESCSQQVVNLVTCCTEKDPQKRWPLDMILKCLSERDRQERLLRPVKVEILTLMSLGYPKDIWQIIMRLVLSLRNP